MTKQIVLLIRTDEHGEPVFDIATGGFEEYDTEEKKEEIADLLMEASHQVEYLFPHERAEE